MNENLIEKAKEAQLKSISPYSNFRVGAAIETDEGKIYLGSNIENASYSLTICAERTAIFNALLSGERKFKRLALVSDSENIIAPCGACRQVLAEFCNQDFEIIMTNTKGEIKIATLDDILPFSFSKKDL